MPIFFFSSPRYLTKISLSLSHVSFFLTLRLNIMDFDLNEFAKVVEEHILLEKRLSEGGSQGLDEVKPKADIITDGILRTESGAGASSSSASSTCSRHTELHAYGINSTSASAFLGPTSGTSSDPVFHHSRGESCLSAASNSLSGFAIISSPPKSNANTNSNGFVGGGPAPSPASSLAVTAAPFAPPLSSPPLSTTTPSNSQTSPLGASVMQYHNTPAHATVVVNNDNSANTNVAQASMTPFVPQQHPIGPDAFREATNLPDVKAVPLRMDRRPMRSYESTAGIFVGQLPVLYSPADVIQLLCAVGAESGVDVHVKEVKMHPRNTCAFVDVNAESVPFLIKYNRMILCDVNTLWMTTNPSRVADLLGVAERCSNRNFSGVPRTTLVLEQSTRDPFTGRRQRPNNNNNAHTNNYNNNNNHNGGMNGNRHNSNTNYGGLGNFNQNVNNNNNFHPTNNTGDYTSNTNGFVGGAQQNMQYQFKVSPSSVMPMGAMMMIHGPNANNGSLLQRQQQQPPQHQHHNGSGFHVLHPQRQQQHGLAYNGSAALSFNNTNNNTTTAVPLNQMLGMMGIPTGMVDANGNMIIIPHYTTDASGNSVLNNNNNNKAPTNTNSSMMMVFPMANMDGPTDPQAGRMTSVPSFTVSSALASNNANKYLRQQPAATSNNTNNNTLPPPSYAPTGAAPTPLQGEHTKKNGNIQRQHQIPHCSTCRIPYVAGLVNAAAAVPKKLPSTTAAAGVGCALCFCTIPDKAIAHSCGNCHTHICLQCMRGVVESSAQQ